MYMASNPLFSTVNKMIDYGNEDLSHVHLHSCRLSDSVHGKFTKF